MPELSIVVPVYKEEGNVPEFVRRMACILDAVTKSYEIIFALDPSPDKTEAVILDARTHDPRIKLLKFSRRFGQPMATIAGLQYSAGDAVIVMDVDLQDPPELVQPMVEKWKQGYDVVYAQRKNRDGETWIKKVVSAVGYKIINRIAEVNIPPNTGDFRLMSRRVVTEVNRLKECHGFCVEWSRLSDSNRPRSYSIARLDSLEVGTTTVFWVLCGSDSTVYFAFPTTRLPLAQRLDLPSRSPRS